MCDSQVIAGVAGNWRVSAVSLPGPSHERSGQPCQDAHGWREVPERGLLAGALADGAGSAKLAEVGAGLGVSAALEALVSATALLTSASADDAWRAALTGAFQAALARLEQEAAARAARLSDLAATMILVAATPELVAAAQIGDGAAVASDAQGGLVPLTRPQGGEYLNETVFLTSAAGLASAQYQIWRGAVARVAAFTDGFQMLALRMPDGQPHAPLFRTLFTFAASAIDPVRAQAELTEFLRSPRVAAKTDDDLTLLLAALG